jgi:myo-inositol-1(or 4)-monophosphatase
MSIKNIKYELSIAKKAALQAGKLLLNNKNELKKALFSSNRDIKLNADILSENLIKEILELESNFPILAEESGKSSDDLGGTYWVVDPLDGTANYARDIPICCVSIALVDNLQPIIGVIYDFNTDNLYEGSIISKAYRNSKPINVSNISNANEGILITGLPNDTDYNENALLPMIIDFQNWRKIRMIGSAAMASAYIASGKAEVYKETKTYLWDIAAGAAIVVAAGGVAIITNQNENFQVDVYFSNPHLKLK